MAMHGYKCDCYRCALQSKETKVPDHNARVSEPKKNKLGTVLAVSKNGK
jgi:hypothetical protein